MKEKYAAVVVTYNRKDLLIECIQALCNQTVKLNHIYIVDNNSNDGTIEELNKNNFLSRKNIKYIKLNENIGGAGGFYVGMKEAFNDKNEWLWIMDDDCIPKENALEELIEAKKIISGKISFLASCAWTADKKKCLNHGKLNTTIDNEGYTHYREYLASGIIGLESATFVALLINSEAIKECGLPVKDYFIWGDDVEYTTRITKNYAPGYQVGKSIVLHKRKGKMINSIILEENKAKLKFWYYMIRNDLINEKAYNKNKLMIKIVKYQVKSVICLLKPTVKYRISKFIKIHSAILAYIFKRYDYMAFNNRFDINVEYKK